MTDERDVDTQMPCETVDAVVVGGGASGLAAAVSAAERGIRVAILEKQSHLGGTTNFAIGSFSAAGTRLQRRIGVEDSIDSFTRDMKKFIPGLVDRDNTTLRAVLAVEASVTIDWLESIGVAFAGPFHESPHEFPRMHNVVPNAKAYIQRLETRSKKLNVEIHLDHGVRELVVNADGRIVAAIADGPSGRVLFRARRGVILAAGDMAGNAEMRAQWLTGPPLNSIPVNENSSGNGQQLGEKAGAELKNMDVVFGPQLRFPPARRSLLDRLPPWKWFGHVGAFLINRSPSWAIQPLIKLFMVTHMSPSGELFQQGAILVNSKGSRFCDEKASVKELADQPGARGFLVMDARVAAKFNSFPNYISTVPGVAYAYLRDYRRGRPDLVFDADSPKALSAKLGFDEEKFESALKDSALSRSRQLVALGPAFAMLTITEGGLAVDNSCRVLDPDGGVIPGLFAAGGNGQGGLLLYGHGLHIGWALTSGRIAGATTAQQVPL